MKSTRKTRTAASSDGTRLALIYTRVSTSEQADSGLSLSAQEKRCRAYCEAQGWEVGAIFTDAGASAKDLHRPELEKALDALKPGNVLVVLKLDRLTRRVAHLEPISDRIQKAGSEWVSISESFDSSSACGRLMLNMMLCLSQWEREVIGERTAAAMQEKKSRRERLGASPLGYRTMADGSVVADPEEQATVARARELRATGLTLRAIGETLAAEGRKSKRGGTFGPSTVKALVEGGYVESLQG